MLKKHLKLSDSEEKFLIALTTDAQQTARAVRRAAALLELNRGKTLRAVAKSLQVDRVTIANWRNSFLDNRLQSFEGRIRLGRPREISDAQRTKIRDLASSPPPSGRTVWTLRLLADKAVELGYCQRISFSGVRYILKTRDFPAFENRPPDWLNE